MFFTKPRHIFFFFFAILLITFSCKEELEPDTIFPEDYFPVYPGSWWVYSNGEKYETAPDYILNSYENDISTPNLTAEVYVPYWNGHYVYGYSITQNSMQYPLKELLKEKTDKNWVVGSFEGNYIYRKTIGLNTSVDIIQYPYNQPANCDTSYSEINETIITDTTWELVTVDECSGSEFCDTVFVTNDTLGIDTLFYELQQVINSFDTTYIDTLIVCDSITHYDSVIVVKEYIDGFDEDTCWISKEYFAKHIGLIKREVSSCSDTSATLSEMELIRYHINN